MYRKSIGLARLLLLNGVALLAVAPTFCQVTPPAPGVPPVLVAPGEATAVAIVADRPGAVYKVGEKANFVINAALAGGAVAPGKVNYAFSLDGVGDYGKGTVDLVDGKATVTGALDKPGVLRCRIDYTPPATGGEAPKPLVAFGGAVFDPFEVQPTTTVPDDFAAFWEAQKAELAKIPADVQITPFEQNNDTVEVFDVSLANINGARVHGYFAKPKGDGPFPALLMVPGAGVRSASAGGVATWAAKGFLAFDMTVHDLPNAQPREFYLDKYAGDLKGYYLVGREDRLTFEFRRIILGCVRCVDFLTGQAGWDKKHMIVAGSSQGGALSLITAGLDSRITALSANVPAMCDHTGRLFGRPSGWPQLAVKADGTLDPKIVEVSRYYDAVNFARRTNVPAVMGIGLIDSTCPSTTCLGAYNVLSGPKKLDIAPAMAHNVNPAFTTMSNAFIVEQGGK